MKGIGTDNIQHGLGSVVFTIHIQEIPMAQCRFNVISDAGMKYILLLGRMFCHQNCLEIGVASRSIKKTNEDGSSWTLYGLDNNKCLIWIKIPYYIIMRTIIPKGSYRKVKARSAEYTLQKYKYKFFYSKPKDELYSESDKNRYMKTIPGLLDLEDNSQTFDVKK